MKNWRREGLEPLRAIGVQNYKNEGEPDRVVAGDRLMIAFKNGGERGIRTLGTVARTTVFETAPFDHSGTSPRWLFGRK